MTIDHDTLRSLYHRFNYPVFVYDKSTIVEKARVISELELPFGYTPRYAVKANNHPEIVQLFDSLGLLFDASSSYEARELVDIGISGSKIRLSSQQPADNLIGLIDLGVKYTATSLHQLELFAATDNHPDEVGLRVNPGIGGGHNNRVTTGGANSSFGLWIEYVPSALEFASAHGIRITTAHIHIGSGADPHLWEKMIKTALEIVETMPDVTTLNMGGGFKIHRYSDEHEADMTEIVKVFSTNLREFASRTGRELHFEIEPGAWLIGHAGTLLAEVVDIVDTGADGHIFLRVNTGMNDFTRPGMYGSQHDIKVLKDTDETSEYVVVGHNCETGDILTPASADPEGLEPRTLGLVEIGDVIAISDTGAYCRSMSCKGYNSYPDAKEIVV